MWTIEYLTLKVRTMEHICLSRQTITTIFAIFTRGTIVTRGTRFALYFAPLVRAWGAWGLFVKVRAFTDIVAHRLAIVRGEGPAPIVRVFDM